MHVQVSNRVLTAGETIKLQISAIGGVSGTGGGFAAEVTDGALIAGMTTQTSTNGDGITHIDAKHRSWTFNFKAPTSPGTVQLFTVVNTVNGNMMSDGDQHAFFGSSSTNTRSTPIRILVNAPGVVAIGHGCTDGKGNVGVFGAFETPTVGNANFKLEGIGLPPTSTLHFILGLQNNPSLDLAFMGAPGCFLHSDLAITFAFTTTAGNDNRSGGKFTMPAPIPNDPRLKGVSFQTQLAVVDSRSKRPFPLVFTNGLKVTIQ